MKKILVTWLVLLTQVISAQELENALLWKISGNDLKEVSYLFGTHHSICDPILGKEVEDAIANTRQLYHENEEEHINLEEVLRICMMKDNRILDSLASADDMKLLNEYAQNVFGVPLIAPLNGLKPVYLSLLFDNYKPINTDCKIRGIEKTLIVLAEKNNKTIHGLESMADLADVFKYFDAVSYEDQMAGLLSVVKEKKEKREDIATALYKERNINAMAEITSRDKTFLEVFIINRNAAWIKKMKQIIVETPTFFGVGAGHLGGENGLIKLLRKQGYTVTPVK